MNINAYLVTYKAIGKFKYKTSTGIVLATEQAKAVELAGKLMEEKEKETDLGFKICHVKKMSCDFFLIEEFSKKEVDE